MKAAANGREQLVAQARQRLAQQERLARQCCAEPSQRIVHDFRIETRRLLASLGLLAPALPVEVVATSRKFLKRQLRATSKLRDLQVQRGLVGELASRRPALQPLAWSLVRKEQRAAGKIPARLIRRHDPRRRQSLDAALAVLLEKGKGPEVDPRATLQRAFVRVDRLRRRSDSDPERLHRLRVALKHYRYLGEEISLGPDAGDPANPLRRAQKCLGELHDFALLEKRIRKYARRKKAGAGWRDCIRQLARRRANRAQRQRRLVAAICLPHRPSGKSPAVRQIRPSKTQVLRSRVEPLPL